MSNFFLHEQHYRNLDPVADRLVTICGVGALGANLAEHLARMGLRRLRLIDNDIVESQNLSTQPWLSQDVGAAKVRILANMLHRAVGARIEIKQVRLVSNNATQLLEGSDLIIDAFDNIPSRRAVAAAATQLTVPCLHTALGGDGDYGCGLWDDAYILPEETNAPDRCDYPLTRPLAQLVAAAAAEAIVTFLVTGTHRGFEVTLRDLRIMPA